MAVSQDPQSTQNKVQFNLLAEKAFWIFVKKYNLKSFEIIFLMELSSDQSEEFISYFKNRSLPNSGTMYRKVGLLLNIHQSLESLYSFSPAFRYAFMHMGWSRLEWKSPMEFLQMDPSQLIQRLQHIQKLLEDECSKKTRNCV